MLRSGLLPTPDVLRWGPGWRPQRPLVRTALALGAISFVLAGDSQQRPPLGRALTLGAATSGRQEAGGPQRERLQGALRLQLQGWRRDLAAAAIGRKRRSGEEEEIEQMKENCRGAARRILSAAAAAVPGRSPGSVPARKVLAR